MKIAMILIIIFSNTLWGAERVTTKSFSDVLEIVTKKKTEFGSEQVLVVYDFDNTLMAMNQDIGSDQWYQWQSSVIKKGDKKNAMADSISDLFSLHYKLFALGDMHLVEPNVAQVVKEIQKMNIKSYVQTSRGSEYRNDVEQELDRVELSFKASAIGPEGGYASTFYPEGVEKPRLISYQDGILMGSGQNKGHILKYILAKTQSKFKSIVFVDDTLKNIENLEQVWGEDKSLTVVYYTHEEDRVKKFEKDKARAWQEWKKVKPVLEKFKSSQF